MEGGTNPHTTGIPDILKIMGQPTPLQGNPSPEQEQEQAQEQAQAEQQQQQQQEQAEDSIYSYVDLAGLRQYLLDCPNMLVMFEVLINHIHEYKQLKREHIANTGNSPLCHSLPI
jgi:hypothetical protein